MPDDNRPVAAFDFDGTLVAGDSLLPFLVRLLGPAGFTRALTAGALPVARSLPAGRNAAKAAVLAATVTGLAADDVAAAGRRFAGHLAGRVRPAMAERIGWHRRAGHELVIISASLEVYLEPLGRRLGFDGVAATRLATDAGGRLTGALVGGNVRGAEKVARLRALVGEGPRELWAYGDSRGDLELLALADHAQWVGRGARRPPDRRRAPTGG